jgi:hypothetical protein
VVLQDPPASSYVDSTTGAASSLQDFIKSLASSTPDAGDGGALLPPPDSNTLYVFYFPPSVTITLDGSDSCNTFLGYHNTIVLNDATGTPTTAAYAIVPRCGTKESTTSTTASHEIIEATTDPDIGVGSLSWYMTNNTLWAAGGGEVGDLCEGFGSNSWVEASFTLQRTWSNKSAAASHNPCVPIPSGEVYFNAAARQSKIVLKTVGATATVDIDAFSDGPYPAWTLTAVDYGSFQQGSAILSFSFDKTMVQNGDYAQLTVTSMAALPGNEDQFVIVSTDANNHHHSWPVLASGF